MHKDVVVYSVDQLKSAFYTALKDKRFRGGVHYLDIETGHGYVDSLECSSNTFGHPIHSINIYLRDKK
jgi:hypothetical protein